MTRMGPADVIYRAIASNPLDLEANNTINMLDAAIATTNNDINAGSVVEPSSVESATEVDLPLRTAEVETEGPYVTALPLPLHRVCFII